MVFAVFVDNTDAGWKLAIGALGMIAGILVLANPAETVNLFQGLFGGYLGVLGILIGVVAFIGAFRGGGVGGEVFEAIIGLLILFNAEFTTTLLITLFAALLLVNGVVGIYMGLKAE
ncbi:MAG: DUF308 domain-containing protein [Acidimicrobiia bacterium]